MCAHRVVPDTTLAPQCDMILEQGVGVFSVGGKLQGTDDDLVLFFDVQRGKRPDEAAFEIPGFCPR